MTTVSVRHRPVMVGGGFFLFDWIAAFFRSIFGGRYNKVNEEENDDVPLYQRYQLGGRGRKTIRRRGMMGQKKKLRKTRKQ